MKIYTFAFKGVWLGGVVIVVAENEASAQRVALDVSKASKVQLIRDEEIRSPMVVYHDDGDY